jgi:hypothetical protein
MSEIQHRLEKVEKERQEAIQELETLREHIDQLQQDCDTYLDEKKTYSAKVGFVLSNAIYGAVLGVPCRQLCCSRICTSLAQASILRPLFS